MRQRFKIFDSDTHLSPNAETLEPYFDANMRKRLPEWENFKVPFRVGWAGDILEPPYRHRYQFTKRSGWRQKLRILGEAGPREQVERHHPKFMGSRFPTPGGADDNAEARIRDMDEEGVDVQLMLPGTPPASDDVEIEVGFIRANHRFTNDFCSKYPHRLKSLIVVSNKAIDVSVEEIKRWASAPWAAGIYPHLDERVPIDHPKDIWSRSGPRRTKQGSVSRITVLPRVILATATSGTTRSLAGTASHPVGCDESDDGILRRRYHGSIPKYSLLHPRVRLWLAAVLGSAYGRSKRIHLLCTAAESGSQTQRVHDRRALFRQPGDP